MKNNKIVAVIAAVAVLMTAVVCALIVISANDKKDNDKKDYGTSHTFAEETADVYQPITQAPTLYPFTQPDYEYPATLAPSQAQTLPDFSATDVPTAIQPVIIPSTQVQTPTQPSTPVNGDFSKAFKMPVAPQYIPPDTDIDFEKTNLLSYKYDPDGGYFYTDDKNCWQKNYGFNEGYDSLAPLGMMNYDTVRVKFVYDNKEWLVQMWKGQYGTAFVGGEVGVYTRPVGTKGTHYDCASEEDWLNMEMAFIWDRYHDGNYLPIFTRDYTKYWWCTGFVPGLETGAPRDQFRLVTHITFESEEMATAFSKEFEKQGFRRVEKLNNNEIDTFVQVGADVAFVWQDIVHN